MRERPDYNANKLFGDPYPIDVDKDESRAGHRVQLIEVARVHAHQVRAGVHVHP